MVLVIGMQRVIVIKMLVILIKVISLKYKIVFVDFFIDKMYL